MNSIRILLNAAVDYAGLFPPARMSMADAVRDYSSSRRGEHSWALGRFVVPVSRLEEFEGAAADFLIRGTSETAWKLSILAGQDISADIEHVLAFNRRSSGESGTALVESLELKVQTPAEMTRAAQITSGQFETYLEIPSDADKAAFIQSIARTGARAKLRTGGLNPESFPSPADLAQFIYLCGQKGVAFKATAGLHHPFRSSHRLTYDPGSPSGMMHGFLNVLLAAAFARAGRSAGLLADLLSEEDAGAFNFDDHGASWRTHRLANNQLLNARHQFIVSFGSCSFREPMDDLKTFDLL